VLEEGQPRWELGEWLFGEGFPCKALVAELYRTTGSIVCKDPSHSFVYSLSEL
jgi:hypothetical protein